MVRPVHVPPTRHAKDPVQLLVVGSVSDARARSATALVIHRSTYVQEQKTIVTIGLEWPKQVETRVTNVVADNTAARSLTVQTSSHSNHLVASQQRTASAIGWQDPHHLRCRRLALFARFQAGRHGDHPHDTRRGVSHHSGWLARWISTQADRRTRQQGTNQKAQVQQAYRFHRRTRIPGMFK